jgi:hypothetical protein
MDIALSLLLWRELHEPYEAVYALKHRFCLQVLPWLYSQKAQH